MTVGQEMYGARLERKNIPPPLSLASFNYPSLSLQQHHIPLNNSAPKSAPPQSTNTDLMQQVSSSLFPFFIFLSFLLCFSFDKKFINLRILRNRILLTDITVIVLPRYLQQN
jgi:hypothetical protein